MKKTAILPIVSVLCLAIAAVTGHAISQNIVNEIADIVAVIFTSVISIWGIYKDHSKGSK